jgi:uncharacterized protein YprB with RNaseH-like and TPR domain
MYKRFSFNDLQSIKNNFFAHLQKVTQKEKCLSIKDFCKTIFKQWPSVYYYFRWEPQFICHQQKDWYNFIDPQDSIEVIITHEQLPAFTQLFKSYLTKHSKKQNTQTIEQILIQEFNLWKFNTIKEKPYIVYDIETDGDIFDVTQQKFIMAYAAKPGPDNKMKYEYIDNTNLKRFVDELLHFDWYIVWFNNIGFDNPVIVHNIKWSQEMIDILNKKSLDLFTFLYHHTGKKIWLNKVASALVGIEKTLDSGLEWVNLYKQYLKTWDQKLFNTFKNYCKNDVKMTILTLLYFIHYQKLHIEWQEIPFTLEALIQTGWTPMGEDVKPSDIDSKPQNQSIF